MTADPDWAILSPNAFGRLTLGMSASDVARFDGIYGHVTHRNDHIASVEAVLKTLAPFAEAVPGIRDNMHELRKNSGETFSEYRQLNSPVLRYEDGFLSEILVPSACASAHFEGHLIFSRSSSELVRLLTERNGGARYLAPELLFDQLCLLLQNYIDQECADESFDSSSEPFKDERKIKIVTRKEVDRIAKHYTSIDP